MIFSSCGEMEATVIEFPFASLTVDPFWMWYLLGGPLRRAKAVSAGGDH